jgi:hypothetical protein
MHFGRADQVLGAPERDLEASIRARASICLLCEVLSRYGAYFDGKAPR